MKKFKLKAEVNQEPDITALIAKIKDEGVVFLFSFVDDETSSAEATITDNYVETNHSVQDHIAIRPRVYRLRGCVGEVVYRGSEKFLKAILEKANSHPILQKTITASSAISAISPIVGNYTQLAVNVVNQVESSFNRYKQMIDNLLPSRTPALQGKHQKLAVAYLNRLLELRQEVNLKGLKFNEIFNDDEAGKAIERKYYLQSVTAHQGNNDFISDIEVQIKEFRIATTKTAKMDKNKYGGLCAVQKTSEANNGPAKGEDVYMSSAQDEPQYMTPIQSRQKVGEKEVQIRYNAIKYQSEIER